MFIVLDVAGSADGGPLYPGQDAGSQEGGEGGDRWILR